MLTNKGDMVFDPFAGSCVTGEVADRLNRRWLCCEIREEYLVGARGRFLSSQNIERPSSEDDSAYYRIPKPGLLWTSQEDPLAEDGGKARKISKENREKIPVVKKNHLKQERLFK